MFMTYLWQSSGISPKDAYDKFSSDLANQCVQYKDAFGVEPVLKIKQIENMLLGQLHYEYGVTGWEPWADLGNTGIIWNGVCEDFLGKKMDTETVANITKILENSPEDISSWNGMFSVIAWKGSNIFFASSATMCPTLWSVEGPGGWAMGSRAAPILELAGLRTDPDIGTLGLYLLYGYFLGGHSAFKHVHRIYDRVQIKIKKDSKPELRSYISIPQYLGLESDEQMPGWDESVSRAADRIIQRVNTQIKHSAEPVVLLTGGRDSRTIAAAAKKSGYRFTTETSGPSDSEDVVIATQVSNALEVVHQLKGDFMSPDNLYGCMDRLKLWAQMNEGLVPVNYCFHMKDFLSAILPVAIGKHQSFHGLTPEIASSDVFPGYPDFELDKLKSLSLSDAHKYCTYGNRFLKPNKQAEALLQNIFLGMDNILYETKGRVDHWIGLFWWRQRGLVWGADLRSAYSLNWSWIPFFDREFIKLSWRLTVEQKASDHYLFNVMEIIAPAAANIKYTQRGLSIRNVKLGDRIKRKVLSHLNYYLNSGVVTRDQDKSEAHRKFWQKVFFSEGEHLWNEFIEKKDLLHLIHFDPKNNLLWGLSTIDMMADLFCARRGDS